MNVRTTLLAISALMLMTLCRTDADPVTDEYEKRLHTLNAELAGEHSVLGKWCLKMELADRAREHFERAVALDPDHADAAGKLAELRRTASRARSIECEFRLRNGDHVKGRFLAKTVGFETEYGLLEIPASEVLLLKTGDGRDPDRVFTDAYTGEGKLLGDGYPLRAKMGDVRVARGNLDMIRFLHPCIECRGKAAVKCSECRGAGRILEKGGCAKCGGGGKLKCEGCGGKGSVTCPLCNGQGSFRPPWGGRRGRVRCPRCNGNGHIDCPDCDGGWKVCPVCKGKPPGAKYRVCPVCKGKKIIKCPACDGTRHRALPREAQALWDAPAAEKETPAPETEKTETTEVPDE